MVNKILWDIKLLKAILMLLMILFMTDNKSKIFIITMGSGISSRRQEEKSRRMRQRLFVESDRLNPTSRRVLRFMRL